MAPPSPWTFHVHPEVVALVTALVGVYVAALRGPGSRLAPRPERPASRGQVIAFGLGVASLWLALGWPVHDVAEEFLYSAHTLQHLILGLVAPPLLLAGTPGWMLRALLGRPPALAVARWLVRPVVAFAIFNGMMVLLHWPDAVGLMLRSSPVHGASHVGALAAGLLMWMPVLSPLPELPRLVPPGNLLYLFLQSILPTVPASFLTFGHSVLYRAYEDLPRLWGISAIADQQVAGLLMKVGAGFLLWGMIAVLFFAWQGEEERRERRRDIDFDEIELELTTTGTTP